MFPWLDGMYASVAVLTSLSVADSYMVYISWEIMCCIWYFIYGMLLHGYFYVNLFYISTCSLAMCFTGKSANMNWLHGLNMRKRSVSNEFYLMYRYEKYFFSENWQNHSHEKYNHYQKYQNLLDHILYILKFLKYVYTIFFSKFKLKLTTNFHVKYIKSGIYNKIWQIKLICDYFCFGNVTEDYIIINLMTCFTTFLLFEQILEAKSKESHSLYFYSTKLYLYVLKIDLQEQFLKNNTFLQKLLRSDSLIYYHGS